jgi:hypothetical protein
MPAIKSTPRTFLADCSSAPNSRKENNNDATSQVAIVNITNLLDEPRATRVGVDTRITVAGIRVRAAGA